MTFPAGSRLLAEDLGALFGGFARKTVDESVTSSTTLQNDDVLLLPVLANKTYRLTGQLFVVGNETGDFKLTFTQPSGSVISFGVIGGHPTDAGFSAGGTQGNVEFWSRANISGTPTAISLTASTTEIHVVIHGIVVVGGTAGNVTLQWAQTTSNATATKVKAGSWISLDPIG